MTDYNPNDVTYSPKDICRWFDITRTTLFRWEDQGKIPKADRGLNSERIYRRDHIEKLAEVRLNNLKEKIQLSVKQNPDSEAVTPEEQERIYKIEFFAKKHPHNAIRQLKALAVNDDLSRDTLDALIAYAMKLPRGDRLRIRVWDLLIAYERSAPGLEIERSTS